MLRGPPPRVAASWKRLASATTGLAGRGAAADNGLVGAREERLGANEALFREVNERVAEVAEQFVADDTRDSRYDFNCECGDRACAEQIALTTAEYEAVRAEATRFAVVPGHETLDIERVVERHPMYLVVEKQDRDAEEVARETDPRT
jgi:hypothetical protein